MSPVISVIVGKKNKQVKINCLLHIGSQGTYLDTSVLERLNCLSLAKERVWEVKTLPILSSKLNLSYELQMLPQIQNNLMYSYVMLCTAATVWRQVESVLSNHNTALRILERVVKDLEKKDLYEQYLDIFKQQEDEGIIEEITIPSEHFRYYIWSLHRPVLKLAD